MADISNYYTYTDAITGLKLFEYAALSNEVYNGPGENLNNIISLPENCIAKGVGVN